jgi:hypothetical protein
MNETSQTFVFHFAKFTSYELLLESCIRRESEGLRLLLMVWKTSLLAPLMKVVRLRIPFEVRDWEGREKLIYRGAEVWRENDSGLKNQER